MHCPWKHGYVIGAMETQWNKCLGLPGEFIGKTTAMEKQRERIL